MRDIIPLNIVGPTRFARYPKISRESTFNMMTSDGVLIPYPGYRKIKDIKPGGSKGRTIYKSPKFEHDVVVIDDGVFTISNDFAETFIGSLDTFSGSVFISENNANEIVFSEIFSTSIHLLIIDCLCARCLFVIDMNSLASASSDLYFFLFSISACRALRSGRNMGRAGSLGCVIYESLSLK